MDNKKLILILFPSQFERLEAWLSENNEEKKSTEDNKYLEYKGILFGVDMPDKVWDINTHD